MRDIGLTLIMLALLPMIFRRPAIGAMLWAWVSIMNPHQLTYGFARGVPWAMIIAIFTMLSFVLNAQQRKPLPLNRGVILVLALMFWMTLTSMFALNPSSDEVWERWVFMIKVFVMLFLTLMLVRGRKDIEMLIWVVVLSLAYYGVKGGIFTVATGGSYRVWGPAGGMIEGNNELAVALVITMPFMYYLWTISTGRLVRAAMLISMTFCAFAILGTQSRGALLSVATMAFVLGLKGKHPVRSSIILSAVGLTIVAFMPDSWSQRMDTIANYREDGSAMQRIWAWTTLWNAALDRPLVGAGFRADNAVVFGRYGNIPEFEHFFAAYTPVAHSSYFQALGEHGFPGLALYVGIGLWIWFAAGALARRTANDPEFSQWVPLLMKMCQASIIGFAVGGAFLSLMLLDIPYYILAFVVLVQATVDESQRAAGSRSHTTSPPSGAPDANTCRTTA